MKHTPGPWRMTDDHIDNVDGYGFYHIIAHESGWYIADVAGNVGLTAIPTQQALANAKLIAAAPELLEALVRIQTAWETGVYGDGKLFKEMVSSAIKKATHA